MRPFLLAMGFLIVVGASSFFLAHKKSPPQGTFKNPQDVIDFLSTEAVKDADSQSHVHLDYSVESIKRVESMLGGIHDQYVNDPSSIAVNGLASAYGAYLGKVIRKTEPDVKWETNDSVGGDKSYPLIWGAGHSYPMAWCYRRIVDGDSDNVWVKYQVLKERASQPPSTTKE
jgi:hypothetical protein